MFALRRNKNTLKDDEILFGPHKQVSNSETQILPICFFPLREQNISFLPPCQATFLMLLLAACLLQLACLMDLANVLLYFKRLVVNSESNNSANKV